MKGVAAESASAPGRPRTAAVDFTLVLLGLLAAAGWIAYSERLGQTIVVDSPMAAAAIYYALVFLPLILVAVILSVVAGRKPFRRGQGAALWAPVGAAIGIAGIGLAVGYSWLNGGVALEASEPAVFPAAFRGLLLGLALTLVQTGTEEIVARGWLQPVLVARLGAWPGILLASLGFAALHLASGPIAPLSFANMTLGGALFGLLAYRSGGLLAPLAAHFAWNAVEDVGLGLIPNPGVGPFGALHDIAVRGPALWGGSAEGLNASVGTTAVLIALMLPLLARAGPAAETAASLTAAPTPA